MDGRAIRHAVEVRHDSFKDKAFIKLCRKEDVGIVFGADSEFPLIADITTDFIYARLMGTSSQREAGLSGRDAQDLGGARQDWEKGESPKASMLLAPRRAQKEARRLPVRDQRRQGDAIRRRRQAIIAAL